MTAEPPRPRDAANMDDILASIRRIVQDEDRRAGAASALEPRGELLELTPQMRIDGGGEAAGAAPRLEAPSAPPEPEPRSGAAMPTAEEVGLAALAADEAQIADIARAVLRAEFEGEFGARLTEKLRALVREEVDRRIDELAAEE